MYKYCTIWNCNFLIEPTIFLNKPKMAALVVAGWGGLAKGRGRVQRAGVVQQPLMKQSNINVIKNN